MDTDRHECEVVYELALFAGAGGGILGSLLCGHIIIGACEIEEYPRNCLLQRQRDGILPEFPVWDDITTFRADNPECSGFFAALREIRGQLCISGGFPCQDISVSGRGGGLEGERSSLWFEMERIVRDIRPRFVFVENSPALTHRGGLRVVGGLASLGYSAKWGVVGAGEVGAPQKRERIWLLADNLCERLEEKRANNNSNEFAGDGASLADSDCVREQQPEWCEQKGRGRVGNGGKDMADANCPGLEIDLKSEDSDEFQAIKRGGWWECDPGEPGAVEPGMGRMAHGIPDRMDQIKALGNAQVPRVVECVWGVLRF